MVVVECPPCLRAVPHSGGAKKGAELGDLLVVDLLDVGARLHRTHPVHAVADEAVAHSDHHRDLADLAADPDRGGDLSG
jgi:hypothetical protein